MKLRSLASAILSAALLFGAHQAQALQTLDARDGVSLEAIVSIKEPTRIRVEGSAITNVFGNIYSSNCSAAAPAGGTTPGATSGAAPAPAVNPQGEVVLECDADKGEIYLRPVGGAGKPINLFVSTTNATYTLVLRRADTPADTIVLRDRSARAANDDQLGPAGRSTSHIRALKAMFGAIASSRVPADIRVEDVLRPMQLWQEARFVLTRIYEGRGYLAERYQLTNISPTTMVLAEQEFDREGHGVLAVSVENMNLRPGETTAVYVIRQGSAR